MSHGSPHDRGQADSYYGRPEMPHQIIDGKSITLKAGSDEAKAYYAGYQQNEDLGNYKDWGDMLESKDYF